jgi:hypothetical protein
MIRRIGLVAVLATIAACSGRSDVGDNANATPDELRAINNREALAELVQIGDAIRSYYGPLEYKKQRFGLDLDRELARAKNQIQAATTEADRVRPVYELLAKLKDGHVSYSYPLPSDASSRSRISFLVTPVEGSYVVARVGTSLAGSVNLGDVLVSIDGRTTKELERILLPLNEIGTLESSKHMVGAGMTIREFYTAPRLQPKAATAHVILKKADGTEYAVDAPWHTTMGGLAGQVTAPLPPAPPATTAPATAKRRALPSEAAFSKRAAYILRNPSISENDSLVEFGNSVPYYLTPAVQAKLNLVPVNPKTETLKAFGVTVPPEDETADDTKRFVWFRAYKYTYNHKTILLVRIPSFVTPLSNYDENVAWLAALLKDNLGTAPVASGDAPALSLADTPADSLVLDVTHNPGGAVAYVQGLATLLATKPIPNFVQANHADRRWIADLLGAANGSDALEQPVWLKRMREVETAYDVGKWLAPFSPIIGSYQGPTVPSNVDLNTGSEMLSPHPLVQWNKPILALHDELSGSGGDAFPAILQNAGVAKTFGARTMGLGGTVESVLTLPHSGAELHLTRGLNAPFHPADAPGGVALIENNGVTPNFPYAHTVADFRGGFVGFATAFSEIASTLTRE